MTEKQRLSLIQTTAAGDLHKCLRCHAWVSDRPRFAPHAVPALRSHDEVRDLVIIRVLAAERGLRALIVFLLAYLLWTVRSAQGVIETALKQDLPALSVIANQFGWNINDSWMVRTANRFIETSPQSLAWVCFALACYATLVCLETVGLWRQKLWGEYLAVIVTSAFIPLEVYEIMHKQTLLRIGALLLNIAAVAWLVWSKRLFAVRGGAQHRQAPLSGEAAVAAALVN